MKLTRHNSNLKKLSCLILLIYSSLNIADETGGSAEQSVDFKEHEKLVIWGESAQVNNTDKASPVSTITPEDMNSINATTTEDVVAFEPSIIIRKRFIGDSNGTVGIRGSNMFQTSRTMVFADGIPLHYFLQTRWSGAPRWTLVAADEIAQVEIIYGPYSAEYSGNSMGGVIKIETAIPTERRVHIEGSIFSQGYAETGFDDSLNGYKGFFSYSDKIDNFSIYTSVNRLKNKGHPQSFLFAETSAADGSETPVSGAIAGIDSENNDVLYFANNGVADAVSNNFKIKIGYQTENWFNLFNIAFEDRNTDTSSSNNYLISDNGENVWNGAVSQNGQRFSIRDSQFAESFLTRESLLLGYRLQGQLTNNWRLNFDASSFEVLDDQTLSSNSNQNSDAYDSSGQISDYQDTGWKTAELKLQNDQLFNQNNLSLVAGIRHEDYQLKIDNYASDDYLAAEKTTLRNSSGGRTSVNALFTQLEWNITQQLDAIIGLRYEDWKSNAGFVNDQQHPNRSEKRTSPKFSIGYDTLAQWKMRYSVGQAYRFPIVEELFHNESRTQGTSLANANLEAEDGLHQNFQLSKNIDNGRIELNIFNENIKNAIFAQSTIVDNRSINTFIPIDRVKTNGAELVINQIGLLDSSLDFRFNITYAESIIAENFANQQLEGNIFPRMPLWRGNLLATYHIDHRWNVGGGIRYASNSFGSLENNDTASNVFGAQDAYTLTNLKTDYQINKNTNVSFGIDNITNEKVFVHHPWPQRTLFLEFSLDY